MDKNTIQQVIKNFEIVRQKPFLFFPPDAEMAISWILGFYHALGTLKGYYIDVDVIRRITADRGWEGSRISVDMKNHGLSEEETIDELLTIHIITWEKILEQSESDSDTADVLGKNEGE